MKQKIKNVLKKLAPLTISKFHQYYELFITQIQGKLTSMQEDIFSLTQREEIIYYNNDFERKVISTFYEITSKEDFKDTFFNLTRNLDPESIETVVKILKRQQLIKDTMGQELDIYTYEEQERIRSIIKSYKVSNFKIAEDIYLYKSYVLPINDFSPSVFIDRHGIDKLKNINSLLEKDIVDVGGYIGDSILIFSPLTRKKVYSFEAVSRNFKLMQDTVQLNHIENAVMVNIALGSKKEKIVLNVSGPCSSVNKPLASPVDFQEEVDVITLDEYVEKNSLDVGLIKVDIEGFEQEFIKGAKGTIKKQRPILLISIYHNPEDFFFIKPWLESWDLQYTFKIHKPMDFTISREVLLIAECLNK